MEISTQKAMELKELIEDTIEYYCDENMISGEMAWILTETLSTAKLMEINGQM